MLATLLDVGVSRLSTVVKTAKDLVPWRFIGTVVAVAKAVRQGLEEAGVTVVPLTEMNLNLA